MRILIAVFLLFLVGCSTTQKRANDFNDIEVGMRKRDVLDAAGNPRYTHRKNSVDRWYYYLIPEDPESIRVVHFKNNKVIYKGVRQEPLLTAEEAESIKAPVVKPYIRTVSDEELRELIKKDLRKEKKKKKKSRYEKI